MYDAKLTLSHMLVRSFKVFKYVKDRKIHFRENWLIFWGILGEAEFILGICGARQNTFRELRIFFSDMGRTMPFNEAQTALGASSIYKSLLLVPILRY